MIPVDDGIDVAIAEIERVAALGARGGFIPGYPTTPYHDAGYDPLWAAAGEHDFPLTFHRTFGGRPPAEDRDELVNQNVTVAGTAWRFFSAAKPFTYMAFSGMFERHPNLKIVAAEVNMGWLPFWAQTADQQFDNEWYQATGAVAIERRPSEYLGDNLFVTVLDDDIGFRLVAEGLAPRLADAAMFSTDYPHSVCLWPNSQEHIKQLTAGLTEADKEKILSGNAARVYGI
jgi:predicted TIM-barrel fold metal-dependent hydrolase